MSEKTERISDYAWSLTRVLCSKMIARKSRELPWRLVNFILNYKVKIFF